MAKTTITVHLDDDLKSAFTEAAEAQHRTPEQLLQALMREAVDRYESVGEHDAWFRAEVQQGLREADDPAVPRVADDEVRTTWRQQRAELARRASDRSR